MSQKKSLLTVAPLFLVLFIDGMGLGLLFPILNSLIIDPGSAFLSHATSVGMRDFLYGLTIGIFMLCWFFGASILGDLSDTAGRRKSLLICLVGAFFGYFISAIAIIIHSLALLIAGRIVAGFTAGSQPIAQAAIVDVSTEEHKARNIGFILLAVSLGFVFGPIIGGVLSDANLVSWFSDSTPLYFASAISLLNAILLWFFFKETFHKAEAIHIKLSHAIHIFISAFQHHRVWKLSIVMLIMIFGWSNYFSFISLYLYDHYHFEVLANSMFLAVLGCGFSVGCGFVVNYCSKHFTLKRAVIVGLYTTALGVLITLVFANVYSAFAMAFLIGVSMAVAYSVIIVMFSNQVNEDEQGWVMGVTGSIMALCFGLTSLFTGMVAEMGAAIPLILSVLGLSVSASLLVFVRVE